MESIRNKIKDWNNADFSNSSASSEYNDTNSNSSDEHNDAISYFIAIFIANVIKYDAWDVKN